MSENDCKSNGAEVLEEEGDPEPYPPWNFSWVVENELAVMAWPQNTLNLDYLYDVGIRRLVTLSPEKLPPTQGYDKIEWTLIPVEEFEDPSVGQILQFIDICERSQVKGQPVGVHCRMGRGRSGVMAACYLVRFKDVTPHRAMTDLRLIRPNSIETPEQERAIKRYFDCLRGKTPTDI